MRRRLSPPGGQEDFPPSRRFHRRGLWFYAHQSARPGLQERASRSGALVDPLRTSRLYHSATRTRGRGGGRGGGSGLKDGSRNSSLALLADVLLPPAADPHEASRGLGLLQTPLTNQLHGSDLSDGVEARRPDMQRGGNMPVARRKSRALCVVMALNVFVCVLVGVSWSLGRDRSTHQVRIPSERFWHEQVWSDSFWNREQQILDLVHNPIFKAAPPSAALEPPPDWLNDTGPLGPCHSDHRVPTRIPDYNTLPQRFQDFLLYMRCRAYPMLIDQPRVCGEGPFLLLAVKSLIPHFDRRQAIRQTWGRAGVLANRTVATVFLLGNTSPEDHLPDLLAMLAHEAELHGDILQWDYRDTFYNLTLKEVLFLEWFGQNCRHARFVLKGDDDVFINTLGIINLLEGLSEVKAKDLFVGDVISDAGPHRDRKLKYFVPESVFVGQYPPYAGGGGYLYSGALALRLRNASRRVLLYPIDDVYTGMCLRKLGLVPEKHNGFKTFDIEEKYRSNPCVYRSLMLVHSRTPQEMLAIWPWIVRPDLDCQ